MRLYAKFLKNVENNPDFKNYLTRANEIEEQKIDKKRKKLFQNNKSPSNFTTNSQHSLKDSEDNNNNKINNNNEINDSNSDVSSSMTSNNNNEEIIMEKSGISKAILRKKRDFCPKIHMHSLFCAIISLFIGFMMVNFIFVSYYTANVQINSANNFELCSLSGQIFSSLLAMRKCENLENRMKYLNFLTNVKNGIDEAFTIANVESIWKQQIPVIFTTLLPSFFFFLFFLMFLKSVYFYILFYYYMIVSILHFFYFLSINCKMD